MLTARLYIAGYSGGGMMGKPELNAQFFCHVPHPGGRIVQPVIWSDGSAQGQFAF